MKSEIILSKTTIKSIIIVAISNLFTIISGIAVGFFVPKILDISDYGFYKTFSLYVGYVGLASLGIIDGIVLKFGEKNYNELEKEKFRSYFLWYLILHLIVSIIVLLIGVFFLQGEYKVIAIFFGLDIICSNFTGYFQYISQITLRFKELSFRNIIKSLLTIIGIGILFILKVQNYNSCNYVTYLSIILICNYILTFWYMITYRKITFGKFIPLKKTFKEICEFIKIGFPLFFSILCASLILTIDRQFVNILFSTENYAIYAFAYNMLSLVTVATSAISTVLYPILKRTNEDTLQNNYHLLICIDICFTALCMVAYFPLTWFIKWFLPQYSASISVFRIIFPGFIANSAISFVMHNYYKTLNMSFSYFIITLISLAFSILSNIIAYLIFKTMEAISIASILTIIIWYLITQLFITFKKSVPWIKNTIFIFLSMSSFYIVSYINKWYIGLILYFLIIFVFILVFYRFEINKFLKKGNEK